MGGYPSLTFATLLSHFTRTELEQLISLLQGYLSVEHKEDGTHSAITADSVTVTGDVTSEGDGTFDGNVTADADGDPAVLGTLGAGLGTGVDLTNGASSRWSIVALTAAVTRVLQIADLLSLSHTYVAQFGSYASGTGAINYSLVPESTTGVTLGENSSGKRLDQVHTKTLTASTSVTTPNVAFPAAQSASADANTLDDYEEGTWTPALSINTSTAGITYSSQLGYYTKKGDEVTLYADVTLTSKGASVGAATIDGLPFTAGSPIPVGCFQSVANMTGLVAPHITIVTTTLFLLDTVASVSAQLADTNFQNTSHFRLTVTYKV